MGIFLSFVFYNNHFGEAAVHRTDVQTFPLNSNQLHLSPQYEQTRHVLKQKRNYFGITMTHFYSEEW